MMACEDRKSAVRESKLSLVLPLVAGRSLSAGAVAEYRDLLRAGGHFDSVEVIVAGHADDAPAPAGATESFIDGDPFDGTTYVTAEGREWSSIVRAGLRAASGDQLVVLDIGRNYSLKSLTDVIDPVRTGHCDIAVAVPSHDSPDLLTWRRAGFTFRLISRLVLGTSDVFSGLFALDRRCGNAPAAIARSEEAQCSTRFSGDRRVAST